MEVLLKYLPLLIPVIIVQLILMLTALIHLLKNNKVKNLNVTAWVIIIILGELIGPILYFLIGKADD